MGDIDIADDDDEEKIIEMRRKKREELLKVINAIQMIPAAHSLLGRRLKVQEILLSILLCADVTIFFSSHRN